MNKLNRNNKLYPLAATVLTVAGLLCAPTASRSVYADEFTTQHTGAGTAASQFGLNGSGITIAVIDSGIQANKWDLQQPIFPTSRVLTSVNFAPDNTVYDLCGHGTHVAGIAAGSGKDSSGLNYFRTFYGVARNANLVNVRVLNQYGQGSVSQVISGIQWCINNKAKYNIRVINLSLGHPVGESYTTDPLCQAVEAAWKAGITVVCAAGNNGRLTVNQDPGSTDNEGYGTAYGSIQSPANDPYVLTVGAMKQDLSTAAPGSNVGNRSYDRIATYSSRGPSRLDMVLKPDIVAPGNRIISLTATNSYLGTTFAGTNSVPWSAYMLIAPSGSSSWYFYLSGTSMAAPVVSGAAALLLQKDPTLTPDTIKARLMISADKWVDPKGNPDPCTFGAGYLNIPAALNCKIVPGAASVSPTLVRDAAGNVSVSNVIWGNNIIWGLNGYTNPLNVIWGTNIIWGTNVIWGSNVIWGTSVWNDNVIWGTSVSTVDLTSTAITGE